MTMTIPTTSSTIDEIAAIYNRIVRRRDLRPDDRLSNDPTLDSLKLLEFIVEIEERFAVDLVTDENFRTIETFAQLAAHVEAAVQCS